MNGTNIIRLLLLIIAGLAIIIPLLIFALKINKELNEIIKEEERIKEELEKCQRKFLDNMAKYVAKQ